MDFFKNIVNKLQQPKPKPAEVKVTKEDSYARYDSDDDISALKVKTIKAKTSEIATFIQNL